jgi:outer membrane protein assembly factor BamD (BamD/ComL family)
MVIFMLAAVFVPLAYYCYENKEKFFSVKTKKLFTLRDFQSIYDRASERLERGLYDDAYDMLRESAAQVMTREFACEALTMVGDLLYNTSFCPDNRKYKDALFFYLLAGTRENPDENQMWRYYQMSNCQKNLGYSISAITAYEDFLVRYPDNPYVENIQLSMAELFIDREQIERAREALLSLFETTEDDDMLSKTIYNMAQLYAKEAQLLPKPKFENPE